MDTANPAADPLVDDEVLEVRHAAHDLRHFIGLVRGHVEVLARSLDQVSQLESAQEIMRAADRITDLFDDLLEFCRPPVPGTPVGLMRPEPDTVGTELLVDSLARAVQGRASSLGIELDFQLGAELPPILGIAGEVERALVNLICNAFAVVPETGGKIEVCVAPSALGIRFSIQDNGPGLPEDYLGDLTELGRGAAEAWRRGEDGKLHGLGLTIAALVARRHRGRLLGAAREDGEAGAVMHLELPVDQAESA